MKTQPIEIESAYLAIVSRISEDGFAVYKRSRVSTAFTEQRILLLNSTFIHRGYKLYFKDEYIIVMRR